MLPYMTIVSRKLSDFQDFRFQMYLKISRFTFQGTCTRLWSYGPSVGINIWWISKEINLATGRKLCKFHQWLSHGHLLQWIALFNRCAACNPIITVHCCLLIIIYWFQYYYYINVHLRCAVNPTVRHYTVSYILCMWYYWRDNIFDIG